MPVVVSRRLTQWHGWGQLNYLCGALVVIPWSGWLYVEVSGWWFIDSTWLQGFLFIRLLLFSLSLSLVSCAMPYHYLWLVNQRSSTASFKLVNLSLIGHGFNQIASTQITSFYLHLITIYPRGNFIALRAQYLLVIDSFGCNKRLISNTENSNRSTR